MRQEIDRAAIEGRGRNNMIAGIQQRGDGEMHRRHAACGADRADAVFQRRQALLQHGRRRIGNARVDVAGAFKVEQACGVIGIVEHIRGGLVNRHGTRACDRVGMLPGVQAQSLEGRRFRSGHTSSRRDGVKPDMSHRIRRLPMQRTRAQQTSHNLGKAASLPSRASAQAKRSKIPLPLVSDLLTPTASETIGKLHAVAF